MIDMPLFPLHTVLFPGAPLRLHIFEKRYRTMIDDCIHLSKPFVVALISQGAEALKELAEPYGIGTTARITQVQRLVDGRMNIVAVGEKRVRIMAIEKDLQPYLVGDIRPFPLLTSSPDDVQAEAKRLSQWIERYMELLSAGNEEKVEISKLAAAPVELAYTTASMLQISNAQKQEILSLESDLELLQRMNMILRQEYALLKATLSKGGELERGFSTN